MLEFFFILAVGFGLPLLAMPFIKNSIMCQHEKDTELANKIYNKKRKKIRKEIAKIERRMENRQALEEADDKNARATLSKADYAKRQEFIKKIENMTQEERIEMYNDIKQKRDELVAKLDNSTPLWKLWVGLILSLLFFLMSVSLLGILIYEIMMIGMV